MWQLRNPKTGENLSDPQPLPENWGPIFGMEGVKDRLNDLSWLGIFDKAWFKVTEKDLVDQQIERDLKETESMVSVENTNMTKEQRAAWIEYRMRLSEIYLQPDYPKIVNWPPKPE